MSRPRSFLPLAFFLASATASVRAEILVKSGEKLAFLGDSITQEGWSNPGGYVKLVVAGLAANGVEVTAIPAGISGQTSNQMLARLDRDVLEKKPSWMMLSCGVNDVWYGGHGVPLDDAQAVARPYERRANEPDKGTFERNVSRIVENAQAMGVRTLLLTATVIGEDLGAPENTKLAPYNDFLRRLAKAKGLRIADLSAIFHARIKAAETPGKNVLTNDGIHMNREGNQLMALGVLEALGLDEAQLARAQDAWLAAPPTTK